MIKEIARAMDPNASHRDDVEYWRLKAEIAIAIITNRLREPDRELIEAMSGYVMKRHMLRSLADYLEAP